MVDRRASIAVLVSGLVLGPLYFSLPAGAPQASLFLAMASAVPVLLTVRLRREALLRDRTWRLLLAGVAVYTIAVFLWYLFPLVTGRDLPFPSVLDPIYFGAYALYAAFLVGVLRRRHDGSDDGRPSLLVLVDAAMFALAATSILWPFLFDPLIHRGASGLALATGFGYPLFVAVLFGLASQLVAAGRRLDGAELLIALWVGAELTADVFYGVVSVDDRFHFEHPMMLGWMVSYAALAAAALHPSLTMPRADRPTASISQLSRSWLLLPAVLTPVAVRITMQGLYGHSEAETNVALSAFVVALTVLAFVRLSMVAGDLAEQRRLAADLVKLTERLATQSSHDDLTGLGNRRMLMERLAHATSQRPTRTDARTAVLLLDLDGFKAINDTLGHHCGDDVLVEVAHRLSTTLRPGDTVTRLGGDEFAVILQHVDAPEAARAAQRIVEALRFPMTLDGNEVSVWASVGIELAAHGDDAMEALKHADLAMYAAKDAGGDRYAFFDATMYDTVLARALLDRDLRGAVDHGQLRLVYQPIVQLSTGTIIGVEALLRWQHPERGMQWPSSFIEAAEDSGAIVGIGRWVLEQSCHQAGQWLEDPASPDGLSIAVNISRRQLLEPDIVDVVGSCIRNAGITAGQLILEVTESALYADTDQLVARLSDLKRLGVMIAMDDFGTGHSTLLQLRQLPIDIVKIDRAFIAHIDDQREDYALAAAVVRLAASLGKSTVAEGVENPAQFAHVRALGVDHAQGYLFAKPLDPSAITDMLRTSWTPSPPSPTGPR